MKKLLFLLLLFIPMSSMFSCGGGSGSSSSPPGEDPNTPFSIELRPSEHIAQTNSFIYIRARVLNGNGNPIPDIPVYFMNLSPIGYLEKTLSNTDVNGFATVKLSSTTEGFVTVQAEINKGESLVRNRKTVYFSSYSLLLLPFMYLEVDGELDDYTLFETPTDNQVIVMATVFNRFGQPEFGSVVTFGADWPYRIGSSTICSDGSATCEVSFPLVNSAITNTDGQASVLVEVDPAILRALKTNLNITAEADNGAASMVTLFLNPVSVDKVSVSANPQTVASGGTSTITAYVTTTAGTPVPDNTTVNFTIISETGRGGVDPFAQTTNGIAEATYTAPEVTTDTSATITAKVGGKQGSVVVTITAPVIPPTPVAPTVTSTTPTAGATTVTVDSDITIKFSANIDCSTVSIAKAPSTTASITVASSDTDDAYLVKSCSGSTAVFAASNQNLTTMYSVAVTNKLKDLAGTAVVASTFSYTTGP